MLNIWVVFVELHYTPRNFKRGMLLLESPGAYLCA